jgi:hypothetical protein
MKGRKGVRKKMKEQKIGRNTKESNQGYIALIGVHQDRGGIVCPSHRPIHPPEEFIGRGGDRGHPGGLHGGIRCHLIQAKPTLG